jgi:hypothetical protein
MKKLPCDECKGKCCQFVGMSKKEFMILQLAKPLPKNYKPKIFGDLVVFPNECPYIENGKCSVWNVRPKVCKEYGEIPEMPCAYLYPEKANESVNSMLKNLIGEK